MKIEKKYLANNINRENNSCKICIEVPWSQKSLQQIYSRVDEYLPYEFAGITKINRVEPIDYIKETKTLILEVEIDLNGFDLSED
jgi:hypothetical protein